MKRFISVLLSIIFIFGSLAVRAADANAPGVPGSVKATASIGGLTKLSWSSVSGATGYVVYFSSVSTGGYERLKVTKALSCITANKLLYYKVRAYKTADGNNVYGTPSKAFSTPEIPIAGLKSKKAGAKILRAWKITDDSSGTSVVVEKLAYGSPIKTTHNSNKYGITTSYTITQVCFIAEVACKPENFGSASALKTLNKTGLKKGEGLVNDIAKKKGAIVAINNESFTGHWNNLVPSEFWDEGPVIKDGLVVQNRGGVRSGATIYRNGIWFENETITPSNSEARLKAGLSFTQTSQTVIWDGKRQYTFGKQTDLIGRTNGLRNQVMFGQIDSTHYLMMVGEFMQQDTMINILLAYGAKNAFACNGGNCAYMYMRGVGNVTGTIAPQLINLDKLNVLEQEWLGLHNYIHGGKGAACPAVDIVYAK